MVKQQNGEMVNFQSLKLFKPVIRLGFCSSFYILCFYRHTLRSELLTVYRTEQIHQFTISPIHCFTNSPFHQFTISPIHQFTIFTNFTNSPIHQFHQFHQFTKIKFWCNSGETISPFHLVKWFNFTSIYSPVTMLSTIHGLVGNEWEVERERRRPRETSINTAKVCAVFGSESKKIKNSKGD